jgi:hypothetical protein
MFLPDTLLIHGTTFVLAQVSTVADAELHAPARQRARLLDAQMRLEGGEITEKEFSAIEADVFERIRDIKARTQPQDAIVDDEHRVVGVEITVDDDA